MSGFDPAWLSLREPADARARDADLARLLRRWGTAPWRIVDLGGGTGANGRWLAPRLNGRQAWLLIDADDHLLAHSARRFRGWARQRGGIALPVTKAAIRIVDTRFEAKFLPCRLDLRAGLRATLAGANVVTASALLDLVSATWLRTLVDICRERNAACLFALTYDGAMHWTPADPFDAAIETLFNAHQQGDKGFGPALGPAAGERAADMLRLAGYRVSERSTPWRLGRQEGALQSELLDGIAAAAREQDPRQVAGIDAWQERRRAWITASHATTTVGHVDILALPAGRPLRS